jgi:hypothetical protein
MTYILMIWTVVAMAGDRHMQAKALDWRPVSEFQAEMGKTGSQLGKTAREMCEQAAQELGLKSDRYRCVRSK